MSFKSVALLSLLAFSGGAHAGAVICAGEQIPAGFVVIKAGSDQGCPGWTATGTNTLEIEQPSDGLQVCLWQTLPRGWVIVKTSSSQSCPGWNPAGPNVGEIRQQQ
jgi:hypothetical protein